MTLQFSCTRFASAAEFFAQECGCPWNATDDTPLVESVLDEASDMLCILSGLRIHGICQVTVRPVGSNACYLDPWRTSYGWNWGWDPLAYGTGPWWLQGTVPLRGPNTDIVDVHIDGALLADSDYGLVNDRYLQRLNGNTWPTANDITLDDTQPGTWSITYKFGRAPDWLTKQATLELACELAREYSNQDNHLPPGVTNAVIQGATVSLPDRADALAQGVNEGIPMVSRFLGVYAPEGQVRSGVWSPELNLGIDLIEVEGPSGS